MGTVIPLSLDNNYEILTGVRANISRLPCFKPTNGVTFSLQKSHAACLVISFLALSFSRSLPYLSLPPTEQLLMAVTIPTVPDEETPLLGGQHLSAVARITKFEPGATTLTDPSNPDAGSNPKKTIPLPWAQFSIVLFLQLTEPLTSQVIYPVSFPTGGICRVIVER